jgi:hypothetical protein
MEKVKVDTEIRKLNQLRSSHINQQHNIRWQVKSLPEQIERAMRYHAAVSADILTRDASAGDDFTMKVGNRVYTGKGAREDAGNALNTVILSWRADPNRRRTRPLYPRQRDLPGQSQSRESARYDCEYRAYPPRFRSPRRGRTP